MTDRIKIDYKGYEVEFHDYKNTWSCQSLNVENVDLSKVKSFIDKYDLETRRVPGIPALYMWYGESRELKITSISDNKSVWTTSASKRKTREKLNLAHIIHDTTENRKLLAEANKFDLEAKKIEGRATAIRESIPRITIAELREMSANLIDNPEEK